MKRGGPAHPKTQKLSRILQLTKYEAVGVLECLFHWAGAYARRGDVGKFSDGEIADGIGWEGDPVQLVNALVESRWLERCQCHRLRIYGWDEHADQAVRKTREVITHGFAECYASGIPPEASGGLPENSSGSKPPAGIRLTAQDPRHKTHDSRRKTPEAPKRKAWTSEAGDDHQEFLGAPPYERIGKALGPLVEKHGWPVVRPIWRDACRAAARWSEPAKFTPEVFARTFVAELAKRKAPPTENPTGLEESPRARAEREAREEREAAERQRIQESA